MGAVEPKDGVFDDAYLAEVKTELGWLEARGIRAVVDMHQDCFARRFGGDGAPEWMLLSPDPFPMLPDVIGPFPLCYMNPKVFANFDDFYASPAKRARLARAWAHVASKLKDAKNVIGWELLNEPFPGAHLPWDFEANELSTLEGELVQAIRSQDPEHVIFFEPQVLAAALPTDWIKRPNDPNVVYAPHWYDPVVDVRAARSIAPCYDGDPSRTGYAFANVVGHARALSCPLWLGEWGIEKNRTGSHEYVTDHQKLLDQDLMSACYWELNPVDDDVFTPIDPQGHDYPIAEDLAHAHPRSIAGTLTRLSYDPATRELQVEWDGNGPAPTLIELPWKTFPQGSPIVVTLNEPAAHWDRDALTGRLAVWADPSSQHHFLSVHPR